MPPLRSKIYFFPRALNLSEIFTEYVLDLGQFLVKICAHNIEFSKSYLNIKGQKVGVCVEKIFFAISMIWTLGWCENVEKTCRYNPTEPVFKRKKYQKIEVNFFANN
jgi:hypothetical protein